MHLNELKALHVSQLLEMAATLEIDNANRLRKQELMFAIMKKRAKGGEWGAWPPADPETGEVASQEPTSPHVPAEAGPSGFSSVSTKRSRMGFLRGSGTG